MNDEEKNAVEIVKRLAVYYDDYSLLDEEEIAENQNVNKSIEIVLNLIEKLREKLKLMDDYNNWVQVAVDRGIELEKLYKENEEWQKVYQEEKDTNFDLIMKIKNDYIPIQEVKDKIDEIKNEKLGYSEDEWYIENEIKGYAIDKLKELLEGGNSND